MGIINSVSQYISQDYARQGQSIENTSTNKNVNSKTPVINGNRKLNKHSNYIPIKPVSQNNTYGPSYASVLTAGKPNSVN